MNNLKKSDRSLKNFGLTESEFIDLCSKLKRGNESLFETTFLAHFEIAMTYLINNKGVMYHDAYDVVMNVLIEFRKRILDDKVRYGNLKFMFTQMCVQRYQRERAGDQREEDYLYINQYADHVVDEEIYSLLDKSMSKLGEQCKKIIEEVYYSKISYKILEEKYNISAVNLRKRKERCMAKLKMKLRQSLNSL